MEIQRSFCPINLAVELFGDKWTLLIIRGLMFDDIRHFRQFLDTEEKISTNILSNRLAKLEKEGIVKRNPDPGHKQKQIYSLTEAGIDLMPILIEIGRWSCRHRSVTTESRKHLDYMLSGGPELVAQIKLQIEDAHLD